MARSTMNRPNAYVILAIILTIGVAAFVVLSPQSHYAARKQFSNSTNSGNDTGPTFTNVESCKISIVESIPIGLAYPNDSILHPSTYDSWMQLISLAQSSIDITTPQFHFRLEETEAAGDSARQGEDVFEALLKAGRDRGVQIRVVRNMFGKRSWKPEAEYFTNESNAQIRSLNFRKAWGYGYMHTKLWIIDRTHFYFGSADAKWLALTQSKELGLLAVNCSCLASDIAKIFDMYWKLFEGYEVPAVWPESLETKININNPMNFTSGDNRHRVYFASSPSALLPKGRTNDLDAILGCINKAEKFINIDVTKYRPLRIHTSEIKYWPTIDNALRTAAIERKVQIKILINWWERTESYDEFFLKSLTALSGSYENVNIEVKLFIIPRNKESYKIGYAGQKHTKYLVTEETAYIGTSNLAGDYFFTSTGIGMVFEKVGHEDMDSIRQQLEDMFNRDWTSGYSHPLNTTYAERLSIRNAGFADPA